jgi:hypothetical protein
MAYTQADLDAIDAQIAAIRGVKSQTNGDRSVTFDLDALLKERARIEQAITTAAGQTRTRYGAFSKGV